MSQTVVINGIEYIPKESVKNNSELKGYYTKLLISKHFKSKE